MLKYIGPFLRINILDNENIKNQLFHLSKESIFNIVFSSNCGITSPNDAFRDKSFSIIDDTINDLNSPLISLYRKADANLITLDSKLVWNDKKFKKEINIASNAYMTLCLLELVDYYDNFHDIDEGKYNLRDYYLTLVGEQLEFYALNLRNNEGIFVDKVDVSEPLVSQYQFIDKDNKFNFSTQALLMSAYYKYSSYGDSKEENEFKNFSLDILNMFVDFKDEIYNVPQDELIKTCFAFTVFYKYSHIDEAKFLLQDFSDLMLDNLKYIPVSALRYNLSSTALLYITCMILYKETNIKKYKLAGKKAYDVLEKLYQNDKGLFLKDPYEKENKIYCDEAILYLYAMILHNDTKKSDGENSDNSIVNNIYKNEIISSGLVLSWPDCPNLDDVERYKDFSSLPDNLLSEEHFKMASVPTPEINGMAPIFAKKMTYNSKKDSFNISKSTFDAYRNMLIFYVILFCRHIEKS